MGQIEELEKELATIRYQVNQIQQGLSRAENYVQNAKQEQVMLQRQNQPLPQNMQQQNIPQYTRQAQPQTMYNAQTYRTAQPLPGQQQGQTAFQPAQGQQPVQGQRPGAPQKAWRPDLEQAATANPNFVPKKKGSTESWIGKHLMGVLASVLIFIALILFASLIIPYLNDAFKIGLMFAVSIALTGFAFYEHKKRPDNTFFTALLACGLGCGYLSVLVTRIYFKAISDLVMYILLLVWGGVVLYMGKKESKLFQVIGNIGYIISALLAYDLKVEALVLPLLVYLLVMGAAFQYNFRKNRIQQMVQSAINLGIVFYFATIIGRHIDVSISLTIAASVIVCISAAYLAYFLFGDKLIKGAYNTYFAFSSAIVFFASYLLLGKCLGTAKWIDIIVFFVVAIAAEAAVLLRRNEQEDEVASFFTSFWIIAWFCIAEFITYVEYREFFNTGALFAALLPIAIYGAKRNYTLFRIQAFVMAILMTGLELFGTRSVVFCFASFAYALTVFIFEGIIVNKRVEYKSIYYFYVLGAIAILMPTFLDSRAIFNDDIRRMAVVAPIGLFNAAMMLLKLDRNDEGVSNSSLLIALNIINSFGMLLGLYNMLDVDDPILQGISVAFTVALACINLRRHFASNNGEKLYAGIKFGIILLASLFSYNAAGYIVSVATLAFGILCIFIGFNKRFGAKELRIYGLVLSMICVVKFIMIDITYENTIGRAISFLISGILCFGISAIYNYFEKQGQQ